MITEEQLEQLLADATAAFPPPADGPARVVAAAAEATDGGHRLVRRPERRALVVAAAVLAACAIVAIVLTAPSARHTNVASQSAAPSTTASAQNEASATAGAVAGAIGQAQVPSSQPLPPLPPSSTTKITKNGSLQLEVAKGHVGDAVTQIGGIAAGGGGYVGDSKLTETNGRPSAAITVRIPATQFDSTIDRYRRLGKVAEADTSGNDVTGEYTDNAARLRTLTTTRDALLDVLSKARAVGDILAVHDRLNDVQTQIEQLQGRQQVLDDQVAMSVITVSVHEPGAATPVGSVRRSAWHRAVHGFNSTWTAVLAHAGSVLAVLLIAGLLAAAVYAARAIAQAVATRP